jgi:hypothetical protein
MRRCQLTGQSASAKFLCYSCPEGMPSNKFGMSGRNWSHVWLGAHSLEEMERRIEALIDFLFPAAAQFGAFPIPRSNLATIMLTEKPLAIGRSQNDKKMKSHLAKASESQKS